MARNNAIPFIALNRKALFLAVNKTNLISDNRNINNPPPQPRHQIP